MKGHRSIKHPTKFVLCLIIASVSCQECPFFGDGRVSLPQPSLSNCTAFIRDACCTSAEVSAAFQELQALEVPREKELEGDERYCYSELSGMLCYFCSPYQNGFYNAQTKRFIMCRETCKRVWRSCKNFKLAGKKLKSIYDDEDDFCAKQGFELGDYAGDEKETSINYPIAGSCYYYRGSSSQATVSIFGLLFALLIAFDVKKRHCTIFLIAAAMMFALPSSHANTVSTSQAKNAADNLSDEFLQLAESAMSTKELQQMLNNAEFEQETIDGSQMIQQISQAFASFTGPKQAMAKKLADRALELYKEFQANGPSTDLNSTSWPNSDIESSLSGLQFDSRFKANISLESSSVKISHNADLNNDTVALQDVHWTAALDQLFRENFQNDSSIRWQYFGTRNGVYRSYPAKRWETNFMGFPNPYDPRLRPWYFSSVTGPKDMVIVMDCSRSMQGIKWQDALSTVQAIVNSLTNRDRFNVLCARKSHKTYWDDLIYYRTEVMSCKKHELIPASTTNKLDVMDRLKAVVPAGGTDVLTPFQMAYNLLQGNCNGVDDGCNPANQPYRTGCEPLIVFITDGLNQDPDVRCGNGYWTYSNNGRTWHPPPLCRFHFVEAYQLVETYADIAKVFSFGVSTSRQDYSGKKDGDLLPGKIACTSKGSYTYLAPSDDAMTHLGLYFDYLTGSNEPEETSWSSPYIDALGLGIMITVSSPVFDPETGSLLGVIGIDVTLNTLIDFVKQLEWGQAYTAIVDTEGETIIHPQLRDAESINSDVSFPSIRDLEQTYDGFSFKPVEFTDIIDALRNQQSGHVNVPRARRVVPQGDRKSGVVIFEEEVDYYFTGIADSDFSVLLAIPASDQTRVALKALDSSSGNYQHHMRMYSEEYREELEENGLIFELNHNITTETPAYYDIVMEKLNVQYSPLSNPYRPDMYVSEEHSVYKLAPGSFCDSFEYTTRINSPALFDQLEFFINNSTNTSASVCPGGFLEEGVRGDIQLTQNLELLWPSASELEQMNLMWTYIGTSNGMFRVFPGNRLGRSYDNRKRPWYHAAFAPTNRQYDLVISTPYLDAFADRKVITLTQSSYYPASNPTSCTSRQDCCQNPDVCLAACFNSNGGHCQNGDVGCSCSSDLIHSVSGADMSYELFHELVNSELSQCGQTYQCGGRSCETKCYLVDSNAFIVSDKEFLSATTASDRQYAQLSLARREPGIFRDLVSRDLFVKEEHIDFQSSCSIGLPFDPQTTRGLKETLKPRDADVYERNRGRIPSNDMFTSCVADIINYKADLSQLGDSPITGIDDSPCGSGSWIAQRVAKTNLMLLVVNDRTLVNDTANWNCHIFRRSMSGGSYRQSNATCDGQNVVVSEPTLASRGLCPVKKPYTLTCEYNSASLANFSWILSLFALLLTIMLV